MLAIYIARLAELTDPLRAACHALLAPDEHAAVRARVFERHRDEQLLTRALCRAALGRALDMPPGALRFQRNACGRPELEPAGPLRFNLTNTVGLVAIAITDRGDIGLDAEPQARADAILQIAASVFTEAERAGLDRLAPEARRRRAVELWTLKEAYMKALGLGFSCPPLSFELDFAGSAPVLRESAGARWSVAVRTVDDHVLATCRDLAYAHEPIAVHHAVLAGLLAAAR